ncbi:polysaccharide deacetylase family protein [Flavobacterium sp. GT3R68]|uniref:polysaccharide deacetylase family protein n=1 Tax=Flavobacterium sp. GT3R68 TaxID=2594437 RepID=UPI000F882D19|nr:polysaccharide deacetylase family protein [Flavobacterium sp. GT3R68]RTY92258.1 hypothetical protein EKL32_17780 [Flavobacterium sp. GSN2]TRW92494.1 polysaccharide deacetylase family protein [Flavobacterium sp. GT3R68]
MKKALKKPYYRFLKLKNRIFHGRPVLVLMYHRVSDVSDKKTARLTVTPATFEKQLVYFKEKYQILRLTDNWSSLKKSGLVITFDDGYADNFINALPLLEKHQIPATVFVTTININTQNEFWWDRLVFDYEKMDVLFFFPKIAEKVSKEQYSYSYFENMLAELDNSQKEEWFLEWEKINHIEFRGREDYRSLTIEELKKLENNPLIDIGLHTHNHYPLGYLTEQEQIQEMSTSIGELKKFADSSLPYLALPHGSYNEFTFQVIKGFGLKGVFLANNYYSNGTNKATGKINRILMPNIEGTKMIDYLRYFDF